MAEEIERKFLIETLPEGIRNAPVEDMEQGYLAMEPGREVRLRKKGASFKQTVKLGEGLVRQEFETSITKAQFEVLWPATEGRRLKKRRYYLQIRKLPVTIDVYAGNLEGLAVAEIEFSDEKAATEFEPFDWMGKELTGMKDLANKALAGAKELPAILR